MQQHQKGTVTVAVADSLKKGSEGLNHPGVCLKGQNGDYTAIQEASGA